MCFVRTAWSTSASCSFTSALPHPEAGRTRACVYPAGETPARQPSLDGLDGRHGARGSAHAFEPCLWSGCDRQDGVHPIRLTGQTRARARRGRRRMRCGQGRRAAIAWKQGQYACGATLSSITMTVRVLPWAWATSRAGSFTSAIDTASTPRSIAAPRTRGRRTPDRGSGRPASGPSRHRWCGARWPRRSASRRRPGIGSATDGDGRPRAT